MIFRNLFKKISKAIVRLFLDKFLLPVTPSAIYTKIENQNNTLSLVNGAEINLLKNPGLTTIEFDALFPNAEYPFAVYNDGFFNAKKSLDKLESLKVSKKPFQFVVTRDLFEGSLYSTDIKVSLEEYSFTEDVKEYGFDILATIKLKQYVEFATESVTIINDSSGTSVEVSETRETNTAPTPSVGETYTVVKGDCLWNIARKYYGSGSKYNVIYNANRDKISNPNLIYPGQILTIPTI